MIEIMVRRIIKIDIGQIVETEEYLSLVEYSMDRTTDRPRYNQNYRGDFRRGNFRENFDQIRIIEIKIIEVGIEEIIEMIIMKEIEVGLGKDSILTTLEGILEVIVGLDQAQELVPIEIELDAINAGNMVFLLRIVQLLK